MFAVRDPSKLHFEKETANKNTELAQVFLFAVSFYS
jgi:hypothetical protein